MIARGRTWETNTYGLSYRSAFSVIAHVDFIEFYKEFFMKSIKSLNQSEVTI